MKFLGMVLVLISFATAGFYFSDVYLSVLKGIKRTERLISQIILGLKSEHLTVTEIFENAAKTEDMLTKKFIKQLSLKNLQNGVKTAKECGFCTDKKALAVLFEVFEVLGKYSAKQQIEELEFCRNKLCAIYQNIEEEILSKAKLSRYSGILMGIFIFIMLA